MRLAREVARFVTGGTGLLTFGAALVGAFARTRPGSDTADTQYVIAPGSFKGGRLGELDDFPGMTIGSWQMRPHSRGSVQARSPARRGCGARSLPGRRGHARRKRGLGRGGARLRAPVSRHG